MRLYGGLGDLGDDAGHGELNGRSTRRWVAREGAFGNLAITE